MGEIWRERGLPGRKPLLYPSFVTRPDASPVFQERGEEGEEKKGDREEERSLRRGMTR